MTLILAFDTSAAHCAAALLRDDTVLAECTETMARGQAEHLFALLETLLAEAGVGWRDLDRIGVGIGPGNFTGTRISVSAARGLSMSLAIPAVGVSGFEALALDAPRPALSVIDGRAGRYHVQQFTQGATRPPETWSPDLDRALPLSPGTHVIGHDSAAIAARTGARAIEPCHSLPVAIARLTLAHASPEKTAPSPLYMRPADAAPARHQAPKILP